MKKFLDSVGVGHLWNKVKDFVNDQITSDVTDKKGVAQGFATLDADAKLTADQLPTLKTINGSSIVGDGDIELDLSLYKIVSSLPTENIDENKIYLVADANNVEGNLYDEYVYANGAWEKLGSYRASIELDQYLNEDDALTAAEIDAIIAGDEESESES